MVTVDPWADSAFLSTSDGSGCWTWAGVRLSAEGRIEATQRFAEDQGHTLLELAIAGLASRPGVASVIAGATKPEQVRANAAAGDWQLTAGQLAELDAIS